MTKQIYKVDQYYTVDEYLKKRIRNLGRQMGFKAKTQDEYRQWKTEIRSKLNDVTGLNKMVSCDLKPVIKEKEELDGYIRQKVIIQTEPYIYMPFYVLIPSYIKEGDKRPAVIAAHGHASAGKVMTAGIRELAGIDEAISIYNGDYGLQLVKEGFVVFCPDARGFGERREPHLQTDNVEDYIDERCTACTVINRMAISLGQSVIGMWVWDLMRLIDYIQLRRECDKEKICCVGLSGGGMQTLWLSALDDRIKACIVSGYYYGFEEGLLELNNCSCNYAPHVWEYIDIGDLGALIAPRGFIIETGDEDRLNGKSNLNNVYPQVEIAKQAYRLFGEEDKVVHHVFRGGHKWHGTISIPELKKVIY